MGVNTFLCNQPQQEQEQISHIVKANQICVFTCIDKMGLIKPHKRKSI